MAVNAVERNWIAKDWIAKEHFMMLSSDRFMFSQRSTCGGNEGSKKIGEVFVSGTKEAKKLLAIVCVFGN